MGTLNLLWFNFFLGGLKFSNQLDFYLHVPLLLHKENYTSDWFEKF